MSEQHVSRTRMPNWKAYNMNGWKTVIDSREHSTMPPAKRYASVSVISLSPPGEKYVTKPPRHCGWTILEWRKNVHFICTNVIFLYVRIDRQVHVHIRRCIFRSLFVCVLDFIFLFLLVHIYIYLYDLERLKIDINDFLNVAMCGRMYDCSMPHYSFCM